MTWAMQDAPVEKSGPAHVLLVLADHANDDGTGAFPSVDTIAWKTRLSERAVQGHLRTLEEQGLIRRGNQKLAEVYIEREDRRPTVYDLDLTRFRPPRGRGAKSAPRESASRSNGVQILPERGAESAPEPSKTTILKETTPLPPEAPDETGSAGEGEVSSKDQQQQEDGAWPDAPADLGPDPGDWEELGETGQLTLPVAAEFLLVHADLPVNDISTARVVKWFAPGDEDWLVPILADSQSMRPLPDMNLNVLRGRVKFLREKYQLQKTVTRTRRSRTA